MLEYAPDDLLFRLCAAVPPPRVHQVRYFGVLASHASLRPEVVSSRGHDDAAHRPLPAWGDQLELSLDEAGRSSEHGKRHRWAWLLAHVHLADVEVGRGLLGSVGHAMLVAHMPFGSHQVDCDEAVRHATRLIAEGVARAAKLEGGGDYVDVVRRIVRAGIPVMGHIGLTPQSIHRLGDAHLRHLQHPLPRPGS